MDQILNSTPLEAPLLMPEQSLRRWKGGALPVRSGKRVVAARVFVFGLSAILTAAGTYGMYQVISPVKVTWLQMIFATLFALTFTWISFSCASACYGFARLSSILPSTGGSHRPTGPRSHGQEVLRREGGRVSRVCRGRNRVRDRSLIAPLLPNVLYTGIAALRRSSGDCVG